ncbi:DUF748 domain-containing protein [Gilvimarinus agarilyticus]|uniref:DUF748 domain-containing protein n=1 Tax=Gilvimarinus agarilyticus TaxID=679259 RepID=UPI00059F2E67|nr:DUF748 domain-containing protein [Gilvimarinus agarilyticus]
MDALQRRRLLRLSAKVFFVVLLVLYLLYVLLGYFYLPGKLKSLAETEGSELLGRTVSAEAFSYNPFTFELTSQNFAIADEPEHPLLQWQQLRVNAGFWATLWNRHLVVQEIELNQPGTYIHQNEDGFNFDAIIARLSQPSDDPTPEPEPEQAEPSNFAFTVLLLVINEGDALYRDSSGDVNADVNIDDLSVTFNDLYFATGDELLNPFTINAALSDGGQLALTGEYRLQPLLFDINVNAEQLNLTEFADFLRNTINAHLTHGTLAASGQIHIAHDAESEKTSVTLKQGAIEIDDLALDDAVQEPPMVRISKLGASDITLDLLERRLRIGALEYRGVRLNQWQTKDGVFRYDSLLVQTGTDSNLKSESEQEQPEGGQWSFVIDDFSLSESSMHFNDQHVNPGVDWNLSEINIHAAPLHLTETQQANISVSALVNKKTPLTIEGALTPVPLEMDVKVNHGPLDLTVFNPYLAIGLQAAIAEGNIASQTQLKLTLKPELTIDMQANSTVESFSFINNRSNSELLKVSKLEVNNAQFNIPSFNTRIDTINITQPIMTLVRDTQPNWSVLAQSSATSEEAKPEEPEPKPPETNAEESTDNSDDATKSDPPTFALNSLTVTQGELRFTDQLQNPKFVSSVNDMTLEISGLSTAATEPTKVELSALVNQHAPFKMQGELGLNPEHLDIEIKGNLKGLELAPMSSYSGTYIGYKIAEGDLNYDFDYTIDGSQLNGQNNVLAESFHLGQSVDSDQAINAPIKLGLALLRDLDGNIDLDLDISGDTQDPSFNIPGLIAKTFVNIIVKAAASPFTLLGSLVDSDEDLGEITFASGSAQLSGDNQHKLQQLVKALNKKTNLNLVVRGNADKLADRPALQGRHLLVRLNDEDAETDIATLSALDFDLAAALDNPNTLKQIERYYRQNTDKKLSDKIDITMQEQGVDEEQARVIVAEQGFNELASEVPFSEQDFEQLAELRAQAIINYLTDHKLSSERINREAAYSASLSGTTVELTVAPE